MKVGDISRDEIATTLAGDGLPIRTGLFTVRVRSPLPEIAAGLRVLYGDTPLSDAEVMDIHFSLRPAAGLGRHFKRRIACHVDDNPMQHTHPRSHALALFEWGLNFATLTHNRQCMIAHAGVVERNGRAIILPGTSGAGKSTLTAALSARGWRLLTDELALIRLGDGVLLPLARPIALKNESIEIIKRFAPDAVFGPEIHGTAKGTIAHVKPPADAVSRVDEPATPGAILFVNHVPGADAELEPVNKGQAFYDLARATINYAIFGEAGFSTLADLVEASDCFNFRYSRLDDALRVCNELC